MKIIDKLLIKYDRYKMFRQRKQVMDNYAPDRVYLNIGAGLFLKDNWQILDYCDYSSVNVFPAHLVDYNINLTDYDQLPIKDNSVDLVYSSHCMEHIGEANVRKTFGEIYRILKPGGCFRLSVPDMDMSYEAYAKNDIAFFEKINNQIDKSSILSRFLDAFTPLRKEEINDAQFQADFKQLSKEEFLDKYIPKDIDFSRHNFSTHICWFNFDKLRSIGSAVGFKEINRSLPNGSAVEEMNTEEFDITQKHTSVYVEYFK